MNDETTMLMHVEHDVDNRGFDCTWLVMKDGQYVQVDPWELARNALENAADGMDWAEYERVDAFLRSLGK